MIRGFYTARTGLIYHQEHMNIISNNMANVNTVGFKSIRPSFTDLIYQNLNRLEAEGTAQVGHGVKINNTDITMTVGALDPTDRPLDFALLEEGTFFAVQMPSGEVQYTRAGAFILSNDDDTFYLATGNGDRVLDEDGAEIELEYDEDTGEFDLDKSMIGVYRFENPYGLLAAGGTRFIETDISGEAEAVEEPSIKQGYLEKSNVELSGQMVKVIEASKAFSFNSRMVQVADEVEQIVNSLR